MLLNFVDVDVRKILIVSIPRLPPRAVGVNVYTDALRRAELEENASRLRRKLNKYMDRN